MQHQATGIAIIFSFRLFFLFQPKVVITLNENQLNIGSIISGSAEDL